MRIGYRPQDYEARLHDGIILFEGVPHRVQTNGDSVNLLDMVTGRTVIRGVDPLHHHLDISSPKLGYLNTTEYAVYLERIPHRRYKQSLDTKAIRESFLSDGVFKCENGDGYSSYLYTSHFRDTYVTGYPSFREARKLLEDEVMHSVATSRDVALYLDVLGIIKVYYKLELIGWIAPGSDVVVVPSSEKAWVISMHFNDLGWKVE